MKLELYNYNTLILEDAGRCGEGFSIYVIEIPLQITSELTTFRQKYRGKKKSSLIMTRQKYP